MHMRMHMKERVVSQCSTNTHTMTTKFAGNATVAGKGTKNKQGRAKKP